MLELCNRPEYPEEEEEDDDEGEADEEEMKRVWQERNLISFLCVSAAFLAPSLMRIDY
jgi:hypothetical protein